MSISRPCLTISAHVTCLVTGVGVFDAVSSKDVSVKMGPANKASIKIRPGAQGRPYPYGRVVVASTPQKAPLQAQATKVCKDLEEVRE